MITVLDLLREQIIEDISVTEDRRFLEMLSALDPRNIKYEALVAEQQHLITRLEQPRPNRLTKRKAKRLDALMARLVEIDAELEALTTTGTVDLHSN